MSRNDAGRGRSERWIWAIVLLVILMDAAVRAHLLTMPLERDEGEYAYIGQLLLHGIPPFKLAYSLKLPGTSMAYALGMAVFGQTPVAVHLGLLLANAATIIFVFLLGKKLLGAPGGLVACATYAVMSVSYAVLGVQAHATHFVVLCATAGIIVFLRALELGRRVVFFASGLLFGGAFLMKQPGLLFVLVPAILVIWYELKTLRSLLESRALGFKRPRFNWARCLERLGMLFAGFIVPFGLLCLYFLSAGVFGRFWFWTFSNVSAYGGQVSGAQGFDVLLDYFLSKAGAGIILWLLAGLGVLLMFFDKKSGDRKIILLLLLAVSMVAICPGLYFRRHYFVLALPAVALFTGYVFTFFLGLFQQAGFAPVYRNIPAAVFCLICLLIILEGRQQKILFRDTPVAATQELGGSGNPFAESPEIGRYIKEHAAPGDRVAVVGSEPQIYFYAQRRSVTGYIYTYSLMDPNPAAGRMQEDMIHEIEAGKPEFLVVVELPLSWLASKDSSTAIFEWTDKYARDFYDVVGEVDFPPSGVAEMHWGTDAGKYQSGRNDCIYVMRRKT